MRKFSIVMALSLVMVFGLALNAMAFNVIKIGDATSDPNFTVSVNPGNVITEGYGFAGSILDGNNVVNPGPVYFTKRMEFDAGPPSDFKNNFEMEFFITNNTTFTWTDFHIDMENENQVINKAQAPGWFSDVIITGNTAIDFFTGTVAPGQILHLNLGFDTTGLVKLPGLDEADIEFTQIATAVPIPAALPLFGTGLLGLGLLGWRRKS